MLKHDFNKIEQPFIRIPLERLLLEAKYIPYYHLNNTSFDNIKHILEIATKTKPGPPKTSKIERFATIVNYCCKAFHLRCLQLYWLHL